MARKLQQLSAKAVEKQGRPGYYSDGGGLYLQVSPTGSRSWVLRFMLNGKAREMGLGSLLGVSLADARAKAADCRKLLADRTDPIIARDARRAQISLDAAKTVLFRRCAESYIEAHRPSWRNEKHGDQWVNTLATHAYPALGALPVHAVDTGAVLRVLEPIWTPIHETATRVRSRIERVLDWAATRGYRSGENPARWKGHLENILPKIERRKRVKHHAALPIDDIGEFMPAVRAQEGMAARALEFVILTATRTSDALGARWSEIDMAASVFTIPAERMKSHREHRVPLSRQAVQILRTMEPLRQESDYVFPGARVGRPLSNMSMLQLLKRMERTDLTVHGFRSTFRDWTAERTSYSRDVCEAALAHVVGDQTEAAYRRTDLFAKRRRLMNEWANFCDIKRGEVVPLRQHASP